MIDYLLILLSTLAIVILLVIAFKNARQRDEELLKKYGSFDKIPPEEQRNHYLG